jgi:hypothetical protein
MPVIVHVTLRGVTKPQYDAVRSAVRWLDQTPTGGLGHFTWWEGGDCHNVDAWESEAAFNAFVKDRLVPGMMSAGVQAAPEVTFHPAHEVFTPREQRLTATPR